MSEMQAITPFNWMKLLRHGDRVEAGLRGDSGEHALSPGGTSAGVTAAIPQMDSPAPSHMMTAGL